MNPDHLGGQIYLAIDYRSGEIHAFLFRLHEVRQFEESMSSTELTASSFCSLAMFEGLVLVCVISSNNDLREARANIFALPPKTISVPRPAILVEIVTAFLHPA
eukprot:7391997-Prymnesium_polylepis.1